MKIEILAGDGINRAFKELGIDAKCTYYGNDTCQYQVWEIDKSDLQTLEYTVMWQDNYGWWRFAKGSNMGTACSFFEVNNHELIAWDGVRREDLRYDWDDEPDDEKKSYNYSYKEYEEFWKPHKYQTLLEYFCDELGASTASNVCALAVDLARVNGLSMAELFKKFQG